MQNRQNQEEDIYHSSYLELSSVRKLNNYKCKYTWATAWAQPATQLIVSTLAFFPVNISSLPFPCPGWKTANIIEITWNYKLIRTDLIESRSAVMSKNLVRWNASRPTNYSFVDKCTLAGQQWFKHSTTLSMGWNERQKFVGDPISTAWWRFEESSAWFSFRFSLFCSPRYCYFFSGTKYQTRRSPIPSKEVWRINLKR